MPDHYNSATVDTDRERRGDPVQPKARQGLVGKRRRCSAIKQRGCPPEIPETLMVVLDDMQTKEDGHKEDENIPIHICRVAARVTGDGVSKNHGSEASDRDIFHSKHHMGFMKVGKRQQTDSLTWRHAVPRIFLSPLLLHALKRPWI
jgi:hypothetical protein